MARSRPKRPIGPTDGRYKRQRCAACHLGHRKCDDRRPCAPCRTRYIVCDDRQRPILNAPFINHTPVLTSKPEAGISASEAIHINAFFNFLGDESCVPIPFRALLPRNLIGPIHENQTVRATVVAIGIVAWKDRPTLDPLQLVEMDDIINQLYVTAKLGVAGNARDIDLLSALLAYNYLFMTDLDGSRSMRFADQVFRPLFKQRMVDSKPLKPINTDLMRLCSLFELRHAVTVDGDTFLANTKGSFHANSYRNVVSEDLESTCDSIISVLAQLIPMNASVIKSLEICSDQDENEERQTSSQNFSAQPAKDPLNSSSRDEKLWLEQVKPLFLQLLHLIGAGSDPTSLDRMLAQVPEAVASDKTGTRCLITVYGFTGILFLHRFSQGWPSQEAGSSSCTEPPSLLSHSAARCIVLMTITLLEQRLPTQKSDLETGKIRTERFEVGMESVIYLEALNVIATEVGCPTLRKRIMRLLAAIRSRGFNAASDIMRDIGLTWEVSPEECEFVCACSAA